MLKTPIIIVNYKTYKQGFGKAAVELTRALEDAAMAHGANVAIAVSPSDVAALSKMFKLPVLAQHIDPVGFGSFTGHIVPESVVEAGAVGTLINHAERRLTLADVEANVRKCKELKIASCVCTNNIAVSAAAAVLEPDFVAVEPPELIGGDVSVSDAQPAIISGSVEAVKRVAPNVRVLCGAGVKTGRDLRRALELGSEGVLLASGVVKASDPRKVMEDLIGGLK